MTRAPRAAATLVATALVSLVRPVAGQTLTLLDTANLEAPRLREGSGIAASRSHRGVYWAHNDSGDGPFVYATDSTGADLGRIHIDGVSAVDWEDIALGPCVTAAGDCLYVADTGDNLARRTSVTVYRVREPAPPGGAGDTLRSVPVLDSIVLRYPGGPRDVEAIGVTPGGALYLASKQRAGGDPHVFRVDLRRAPLRVVDLGPVPVATNLFRGRLVTGGAISADGRWLVLRTYVSVHLFRILADGTLAARSPPTGVPIPVIESQGEGIDFDGSDRLVLIGELGESSHALVARLRLGLPDAPRP